MSDTILVSVCCLAYNHSRYIRKCLDGILEQKTQFEYEIIINDDASTDDTADIIKEYEALYPTIIKPIYQTKNQFSQGTNMLDLVFSHASGKYIAICECDDYWTDNLKLQKQVDLLERDESYGCVYTRYITVDVECAEIDFPPSKQHQARSFSGDIFSTLLYGNFPQTLTVLFRADLLSISLEDPLGVDYSLFLKLALQTKFYFLPDVTGAYRINPAGLIQSGNFFKYDIKGLVTYYYCQYLKHREFRRPFINNMKIHVAFLRNLCFYSNFKRNPLAFKLIVKHCWLIAFLIPLFFIKNGIRLE